MRTVIPSPLYLRFLSSFVRNQTLRCRCFRFIWKLNRASAPSRLCKQRITRDNFPVDRELLVFSSYKQRNKNLGLSVIKLKLDQKGNIFLWLPRKSHVVFKINDEMRDEINKQYAQTIIICTFWETSFSIFAFADSHA